MNSEKNVKRSRLREYLKYDKETGLFRWRVSVGRHGRIPAGTVAGSKGQHGCGYIDICFDGKLLKAHRLAWFYVTGKWPRDQLDHINGVRHDNRWSNLRECVAAKQGENRKVNANSSSGLIGVNWHKRIKMWQARIGSGWVRYHLGYWDSKRAAAMAYAKAKKKLHAFNPNQRSA